MKTKQYKMTATTIKELLETVTIHPTHEVPAERGPREKWAVAAMEAATVEIRKGKVLLTVPVPGGKGEIEIELMVMAER